MDFSNISQHMSRKLQTLLPKIAGSHGASAPDGVPTVDLSIAENYLLRNEFLSLIKEALTNDLQPKVNLQNICSMYALI
jgi:hypothetical protein